MSRLIACACIVLLAATACSKPVPPPTEQPPEPQAAQPKALTRAIQQPIDRAKAVEDTVLDAADERNAEIEAQTGN